MLMEVIQLGNCQIVRFVNSIFYSNSYLITFSKDSCVLIDCGDTMELLKYITTEKLVLKGVFLTHTHYDHIYGLNFLTTKHPTIDIYTNSFGLKALSNEKLNLSLYHKDKFRLSSGRVNVLHNNEVIYLDNDIVMKSFLTPGHDKSSLVYCLNDCCFTGDSYIPGKKVVTLFPNSNKRDAIESEQKIKNIVQNLNLFPGHGPIYKNK